MSAITERIEAARRVARARAEAMPEEELREIVVGMGYDTARRDFVCSDGRTFTMERQQLIELAVSAVAVGMWAEHLEHLSRSK